ncbi:MAG: hypothetical protein IK999_01220, partial [Ruminococcus sp.]|nr:hypothetical protein [Ruminococcus sp.]
MSARTVNIRYGVLILIMMMIALLSRISNSWFLHDSSHIVMLLVCVVWFNTLKYRIINPCPASPADSHGCHARSAVRTHRMQIHPFFLYATYEPLSELSLSGAR